MGRVWNIIDSQKFKIVDRQGMTGKVFGGLMLFFAGLFFFWLGKAFLEYFKTGTRTDWVSALPGILFTLFISLLFLIPGLIMVFYKKTTFFYKNEDKIFQITSFLFFKRKKEFKLSDVTSVLSRYKKARINRPPYPVVEIVFPRDEMVELVQFERFNEAEELGRSLAGFIGVEYKEI